MRTMSKILFGLLMAAFVMQPAETKYGKPLEGKPVVTLAQLAAKPDDYIGKEFQVKGKITEVCQVMGCWLLLTDGKGSSMKFQGDEATISFPKNAAGRMATVEGTLAKYSLTKEQALAEAKHAAEDSKRPFHPELITGPKKVYQIEGERATLAD